MAIILGTSNSDTLAGSTGNDVIRGFAGGDLADGDLGDDLLTGGDSSWTPGSGDDTLTGGDGNDRLDGEDGDDLLVGGAGTDEVSYYFTTSAVVVDLLAGTAADGSGGTDTLNTIENVSGSAYGDSLTGDTGDNVIRGLRGDDTINGGTGSDWVYYDRDYIFSGVGGVVVDLASGTATDGFGDTDSLSGIENVSGSGANDLLTGDGGANILYGQVGDDTLNGGGGNDTLRGDAGNDSLSGGTGTDTAILSGLSTNFVFSGTTASFTAVDTTNTGAGTDTLDSIEFIQFNDGLFSVASLWATNGNSVPTVGSAIDLGTLAEDGTRLITSAQLLAGASDADNDPLSVVNLTASSGTLADNGDGTWTYTPAANDDTGVTFSYGVSDGYVATPQSATLDLTPVNDAPAGGADSVSGTAGQILTLGAATLLGNDTDVDTSAGTLSIGAVQNGTNGTVVLNANGSVSFTPAAAFSGTATFYYRPYDGATLGALTLVSVNVQLSGLSLTGTAAAETLNGGTLDDILLGLGGNDTLNGNAGNDTLDGGTGNDRMVGGAGSDVYFVDSATDVVSETIASSVTGGIDLVESALAAYTLGAYVENGRISAAGAANLTGNGLANILIAGAGNNVLNGGAGVDSASYETAGSGVTVDLGIVGAQATGGSGTDTLVAIEGLIGSAYDDTLAGNTAANSLQGGDGDDSLAGGSGNDTLDGGPGNDTLDGGIGTDTASFASATSAVTVDLGNAGAQATGGAGSVTLVGIEILSGSSLDDTLSGDASANTLFGMAGSDSLAGGLGNDTLDGGLGDDTLDGGAGNDRMIGGNGNDRYIVGDALDVVVESIAAVATGGTDTVVSLRSAYTLTANVEIGEIGTAGAANLTGNGSANTLIAGAGNNVLNGGAGIDMASYAAAGSAVTVSLAVTTAQATGGSGTDTLTAIEGLIGSGFGDTLTGSTAANILDGGAGDDSLSGGSGNDTLDGGTGTDTLDGGLGLDVANFAAATAALTLDLGNTGAQAVSGAGTVTLIGIEGLAGAGYDDSLTGDALANILQGGAGNDTLGGGLGKDTLDGGLGDDLLDGGLGGDRMTGGGGNDRYIVDDALDVVVEAAGAAGGSDTVVSLRSAYTLAANVENGEIGTAGAANLTGNGLANLLSAGAGDNVINGGAGIDTVSYATAGSGVTVSLALTTAQATGGSGTDRLSAVENVVGSSFDDLLTGSNAANRIEGGAGDDTLNGGLGSDILDGAAGSDSFVFGTALGAANVDTILSFNVADDSILLENTGIFSALTATGALSAEAFRLGTAAADASDRIIYDAATGNLFYDSDGTGAAAAVRFAVLGGVTGILSEADFFVF